MIKRPYHVTLTLELTIVGPLVVPSSESGPYGTDLVCLRDDRNHLLIPGSTLKGLFREAVDQLDVDPFGAVVSGSTKPRTRRQDQKTRSVLDKQLMAGDQEERPSGEFYPIEFHEFRSLNRWPAAGARAISHNSVDESCGTVNPTGLWMVDCPIGVGEMAVFRGDVTAHLEHASQLDELMNNLQSVFYQSTGEVSWIPGIGSNRTTGSGQVTSAKVIEVDAVIRPGESTRTVRELKSLPLMLVAESTSSELIFNVEWSIPDPFCVPEGIVNGNIFESASIVRGDIIKGALARLLKQTFGVSDDLTKTDASVSYLCHYFNRLTTTAIRPRSSPPEIPMSLAIQDGRVVDFALADDDVYRRVTSAPAFRKDWKPKDWKQTHALFPPVPVYHQLRVRTAIQSDIRRAGEEQLFALRMVMPSETVWCSRIVIDRGDMDGKDLGMLLSQLQTVLQSGHLFVGKTKARVIGRITHWLSPEEIKPATDRLSESLKDDAPIVVVLQSPALLIDWQQLVSNNGQVPNPDLTTVYRNIFSELSDGTLQLVRHFASHQLVGGFRAWETQRKSQPYNPILLTRPGSTFVLQQTNDANKDAQKAEPAEKVLLRWRDRGLCDAKYGPLRWVCETYGDGLSNPYLAGNGYGEVLINQSLHEDLRASSHRPAGI